MERKPTFLVSGRGGGGGDIRVHSQTPSHITSHPLSYPPPLHSNPSFARCVFGSRTCEQCAGSSNKSRVSWVLEAEQAAPGRQIPKTLRELRCTSPPDGDSSMPSGMGDKQDRPVSVAKNEPREVLDTHFAKLSFGSPAHRPIMCPSHLCTDSIHKVCSADFLAPRLTSQLCQCPSNPCT